MRDPSNQVLTDDASSSTNFYKSDHIFRHYLQTHLADSPLEYMRDKLKRVGQEAATSMDALSFKADQESPKLKKRTKFGETVNGVQFHPAYWKLVDIAAESEMFYVKYNPELRERFEGSRNALGFAAGQLYAMSETGVYCPLCMTDGAAHLVDQYAPEDIRKQLLPKLSARKGALLNTGAMFLTEKSGGSDVGRNVSTADKISGRKYKLNGEKWFCSNVNAEVIMALARTGNVEDGTQGLSLFLVEKELPDGSRNPMNIIRLKEKLGVRSMATGEVEFENTIGIRLGEENRGFKVMTEMINISRMYNSVAAVAGIRRAIIESYEYLSHRITFGKKAVEHALIRQKFHEVGSLYLSDFLLTWRAIRAMDSAEQGNQKEKELMRILIPMAKWSSADHAVYIVRECMELMGGNGYIEDFVMPKLLRDLNVLPIWEGSGNIIVLDILRAIQKSEGLDIIIDRIRSATERTQSYGSQMQDKLDETLAVWKKLSEMDDREVVESTGKPLFEVLIHLYQMALMIEEYDERSQTWIDPAMDYMASKLDCRLKIHEAPDQDIIRNLIGWKY